MQKKWIFRLLEIAWVKKKLLFLSWFFSVLQAIFSMVPYVLMLYLLQELFDKNINMQNIKIYFFYSFLSVFISFIFLYISWMLSHIAAFDILYNLRCAIAEKLWKLPMSYISQKNSWALKKILSDDVERIETFVAHWIPDFIRAFSLPVIILSYLFFIDWRLALVSFIPLVILVFIASSLLRNKERNELMEKYHISLEEMNSWIVEFVRAIDVMKIFNQTAENFKKYSKTVYEFDYFVKKWTEKFAPIFWILISFLHNSLLPVLLFWLYFYFKGNLLLSTFLLFLILWVWYIKPAFALVVLSTQIVIINYWVWRMDEILFNNEELLEWREKLPKNTWISFENVCFSYVSWIKVLDNISFNAKKWTLTAFVWPSGSWKSTAWKLLARFYDPNLGEIKIGWINIKNFKRKDLKNMVWFVFQDNMMFQETIFENIRMWMDKTKQEIISASKKAKCHDFIKKLPNWYDTKFGSKWVFLSWWEKQRIQIARVILKNPPILLFDEATAFCDPKNEFLILEAINNLVKEKTVIMIAHRLSTIAWADQIVVFQNWKIEKIWKHEMLLKNSQLYKKMWNAHISAKNFKI